MQGSVCLSVGEGSEALLPDKARQELWLEGDWSVYTLVCIPVVSEHPDVKNRGYTRTAVSRRRDNTVTLC